MCNFNAEDKLRRRRLIAQDMTISPERVPIARAVAETAWNLTQALEVA